jgi:hypothetical protein
MIRQSFFCIFLFIGKISFAQNTTYFISPTGNDANNGLNIASAWQTLSPVNNLDLEPGDRILLEGGQNFTGFLLLDANDYGTPVNPITISSYGNSKAILNTVNHSAVYAINTGGIRISNIIFKGDGTDHNGIAFMINQTTADIENISIDSVDVSDFGGRGLLIGAYSTDKGFNHVNIQHSNFHDNLVSGAEVFGTYPLFSNTDFEIAYCKFYNNNGKINSTSITGNGVVVSGVDGGIIEYCEAYNNGANNRSPGGGPVGIWVYDAKNIVIQFSESHHNKAGLLKDGGGFDIDGGSQYCTIQYCYSHDNEGAGFALVEYGSANEFIGNTIRYNVSQNDGRKNSFSGILLFAVDSQHPVKNSEVYNNTVYANALSLTDGKPSALSILSKNFSNVNVRNNIFYVTAGVDLVNSVYSLSTSEIYLQNNNYFSSDGVYDFWWNGLHYTSFNTWRGATLGQETQGIAQNPLLENAGTGGTVQPADGGSFNSLFGYFLNPFSPLVDKGAELGNMGPHDFFGNALPVTPDYDIGASEAPTVSILPLNIIRFAAKSNNTSVLIEWTVNNEDYLQSYEIQKSENGNDFKTIGVVTAKGANAYSFADKNGKNTNIYYRLRYMYPNGKFGTSKSIRVSNLLNDVQSFYHEGKGVELVIYTNTAQKARINTYSHTGALMSTFSQNLSSGHNSIMINDAVKWKRGLYLVQLLTTDETISRFVK